MTYIDPRDVAAAMTIPSTGFAIVPPLCEWFALCANEATTTRRHPILGDVPICQRCDDKTEAMAPSTLREVPEPAKQTGYWYK